MSFKALAWAVAQRVDRSADKLILLGLADRHNTETDRVYPSIQWLCDFSSLDRKTVITALSRLEALNPPLLEDTGNRVGKTKQIKVYRLCLENEGAIIGECHYVYRLTHPDTREFYIGVRSFMGDPEHDTYRGSGRWPTGQAFNGVDLHREIVALYPTRDAAERAEVGMIRQALKNSLCRNILQQSQKRNASGNQPVFPLEQTRKRDTEPVRNRKHSKKDIAREITDDWKPDPDPKSETAKFMATWPDGFQACEVERFVAYHRQKETKSKNFNRQWATWALGPYCRKSLKEWDSERSCNGQSGNAFAIAAANFAARKRAGACPD